MKILRKREYVESTSYYLDFRWRGKNSGFSFPCDESGNLLNENPASTENYQKCIDGTYDVISNGIIKRTNTYWEPAIGICIECGEEVVLCGFTNTCVCGADYNSSGQRLAPRNQWGEETGESPSDILRIP
jgi:hypothetical protein